MFPTLHYLSVCLVTKAALQLLEMGYHSRYFRVKLLDLTVYQARVRTLHWHN